MFCYDGILKLYEQTLWDGSKIEILNLYLASEDIQLRC